MDDFGHFDANSKSHWTQYVSFMNRSGLTVDYFMVYNFKIWWVGAYRGMGGLFTVIGLYVLDISKDSAFTWLQN